MSAIGGKADIAIALRNVRMMTTILFVKRRMASLLLWVRTTTQLTDCASGEKHYLVRVRS
jgi:hypothetical protein